MTPRQKAEKLLDRFEEYAEARISNSGRDFDKNYCSKQCALIAVDEILNALVYSPTDYGASILFWNQVKTEIEKL